ncbi:WXG100 family type VII secretion target [Arthrobacter sp. AFG20]|uniref:WXG100 family type VII secretion target n=1 Tax=Arthrobacter sp. AFG20 TaxID=1688671 RepID=UPI0015E1326E|nr:WXG100 family type VII secretion target [Arthrobacter sp. AFG20]
MTGNLWGADVAQLRTLAQQFGNVSDHLMQTSLQLTNQINSNPSWKGNDATQFRSDWNGNHRALIQRTVRALKDESRKLLDNANEQEKASDAAPGSGGGPIPGGTGAGEPGGSGSGSKENPWGPDWLAKGSPFRDFWGARSQLKAGFDLPKNVFGLAVLGRQGAEVLKDAAAWKALPGQSITYNLLDSGSDLLGAKNLFKYFPPLSNFRSFFEEAPLLFKGKGPVLEALGKGGLGRGVGWLGVGLNGLDTARYIAEGKTGDAIWSGTKTALGVACFLPPPAGTVCQVASAGIAIYEIPAVKSFVNGALEDTGKVVAKTATESAAFAVQTGKNLADMGKSAAKFLGIG